VVAYAGETAEAGWRGDAPRRAGTVSMLSGRRRRFTDIEGAEAFLAEWKGTPLLAEVEGRSLAGDGAFVRSRLEAKAQAADADEVFVMATGPSLEARIASLELIKTP